MDALQRHVHRSGSRRAMRIVKWRRCVIGAGCPGDSHGGVVLIESCLCGATRHTESNGVGYQIGRWRMPPTKGE
jgi:hypothetical protein